ncbi:MAG: rhodanese-like domain-containing protein [Planctomycetes bacterium]|nr:rhodanese-like domain-containing protein [Planctomycetota bacterium]
MNGFRSILVQIVVLLVLSTGLGLGFNAARPDRKNRINLGKDYFKKVVPVTPTAQQVPGRPNTAVDENGGNDAPADSPREHGYQTVTFEEAFDVYNHPKYENGLYIFIDARDDDHYAEAHVPGAYQVDHYRVEQYLPDVLLEAMGAEKIVVYCNGGDCEDSILVCGDLYEAGVPREALFLYEGGMKEWQKEGAAVQGADD